MRWSASSLPQHCGHAKALSRLKPPSPNSVTAMAMGTEFHAIVEKSIQGGERDGASETPEVSGWADALLSSWVAPKGCMAEVAWGLTPAVEYVAVEEPEPHKYVAFDGRELLTAGRADAVWITNGIVAVADWKTGKWPVAHPGGNLQLLSAGLALSRRFNTTHFVPAVYYARNEEWVVGDPIERDNPKATMAVLEAANRDESPVLGDHCGACWERKNCKAYKEQLKNVNQAK